MYIVINLTKQEVVIGDLNLSIGPKKSVDLDKMPKITRQDIENSSDITRAQKQRKISIRHNSEQTEPVNSQVGFSSEEEMIEKITDSVANKLKESIPQAQQQSSDGNEEVVEVLKRLESLISQQGISSPVQSSYGDHQQQHQEEEDQEEGMDEGKMADIHAKTIKNKTKDTSGKVSYEKKTSSGSDVSDQADELSELL